MAQMPESGTILAADFGSVHTRVVLIGMANGQYRLISGATARSTITPPFGDVGEGLGMALLRLTEITGRNFISEAGQLITPDLGAEGVDRFVATASGGKPMRAVLVGLTPDISLESGRRATTVTYLTIVDTISLADARTESEQLDAILERSPDLIFIVGGTDGGAEASTLRLLRTVSLSVQLADNKPIVLYAGNSSLREEVRALFEDQTELLIAENVRPSLREENLAPVQAQLAKAYDIYKVSRPGGFADISNWVGPRGIMPTAQGFSGLIRILDRQNKGDHGVLGIDLGSTTTVIAATLKRELSVTVRSDLGLGHSATGLLQHIPPENIAKWLTYEIEPDAIRDYLWNKWLHPATIPQTAEELELEHAITREIIRAALDDAHHKWRERIPKGGQPQFDPILISGSVFAHAPHPGHAALLLLDALQPIGIGRLWLDPYSLAPALGAMAHVEPIAVAQIIDSEGFPNIGTFVAPKGKAKAGKPAIRTLIRFLKGNGETLKILVRVGEIKTVPILPGDEAEVTVQVSRKFDLGRRGRRRAKFRVKGGLLGLILDARGRPLVIPPSPDRRGQTLRKWEKGVTSA